MKRKYIVMLAVVVLIVAGVGIWRWQTRTAGPLPGEPDNTHRLAGKIKLAGFHKGPGASCLSLTPSCGYCPCETYQGDCYLTQAQFDAYKKEYPEVKAAN